MKINYETKNEEIFGKILEKMVGEKLSCNDGSGMPDFILRKNMIKNLAKTLNDWYREKYSGIALTVSYASEYINETYPIA